MQHKLPLLAAVVAAAALLVPAGFAGTPNGNGLWGPYYRDCTGAFDYHGPVTMAPGATLWADGHHLVVMDVTLTFIETGDLYYYHETGAKVGKVSGGIETCQGDFPEYGLHAISHSVVVP